MGSVRARLSIMMFLQFFLWGAWYVTPALFLGKIGFGSAELGWVYSVGPIAGILSPFFVGMFADRYFSTERILGVMHLLGAAAMFGAIQLMQQANPSPPQILGLLFVHMLCYFPTLSLTNTLALHNMTKPEQEFPLIRVFGTIGWIAAGIAISAQGWDDHVDMFKVAACTAVLMGLYSFTLPHTPPPLAGKAVSIREILGVDALVLLKRPSYLTFMVSSFLVCIPLAFYYQFTGKFVDAAGLESPAFKMSFGQMSEIFFMLVMPLFFVRLGVKWMLFVGMLAWVIRYALFALGADGGVAWMVIGGIVLHGICYDFFFVTGQIYTDRVAPKEIRGQAQGMLVLFTIGLGMLIGAQIAAVVENKCKLSDEEAAAGDAVGEVMKVKQEKVDVLTGVKGVGISWFTSTWRKFVPMTLDAQDAAQVAELRGELTTLRKERSIHLLKAADWKTIWMIPAIGAAAIMIGFALMFKDNRLADGGEPGH
jgi:nucleoside transporter